MDEAKVSVLLLDVVLWVARWYLAALPMKDHRWNHQ